MEFKNSADMFSQNTKAMKETNDCTVKAFAVVFDTSYEKAHAHLKHNCGRQNREGRFYVCVRGHALAVVDGVIYDYKEGLRRQVTWAMRVYLEDKRHEPNI